MCLNLNARRLRFCFELKKDERTEWAVRMRFIKISQLLLEVLVWDKKKPYLLFRILLSWYSQICLIFRKRNSNRAQPFKPMAMFSMQFVTYILHKINFPSNMIGSPQIKFNNFERKFCRNWKPNFSDFTKHNCCIIFLKFCVKGAAWFTHFWPMFPFYNPWKHQKAKGFLEFSGGVYNRNISQKWIRILIPANLYLIFSSHR